MRWQKLEHYLHQWFQNKPIKNTKLLVACSGGADSVALLCALVRVAPPLELKLSVAHVHHGGTGQQLLYRDQAQSFTKNLADKLGLSFSSCQADRPLGDSEECLRDFRLTELGRIAIEQDCEHLVLGHHAGDLLETRLFRLLRGTGLYGLVAMTEVGEGLLRPLLAIEPEELRTYLQQMGQDFVEDPSNADCDYFRNWMRQEWLPQLEAHRPGSLRSLSRSLNTIIDEGQVSQKQLLIDQALSGAGQINRAAYLALGAEDQLTLLARCLRSIGELSFSRGQIKEHQKQLRELANKAELEIGKFFWRVNAERISVIKRED